MGLIATTIEEQIQKLLDRGMIIEDVDKAKEILLDIGYYRLGFYWHHFEIDGDHNFQSETSFEDVIKLYYLDIDLKNILSKFIYRIEVHFRTQLVYFVSNKYEKHNTWYNMKTYVNENILKDLQSIYFVLKKKNKIIKNHHDKYPNDVVAPAWKTLEFLTFGQVYKIYSNIKDIEIKNEIANVYGFRDYKLLDNFMISIINIRNICSHNGVLFDYDQPKGIRRIPHKKYRIKTSNQTNLNASLRLILFMLSKVSINRANELEEDLKKIIGEADDNKCLKNVINNKICFDL